MLKSFRRVTEDYWDNKDKADNKVYRVDDRPRRRFGSQWNIGSDGSSSNVTTKRGGVRRTFAATRTNTRPYAAAPFGKKGFQAHNGPEGRKVQFDSPINKVAWETSFKKKNFKDTGLPGEYSSADPGKPIRQRLINPRVELQRAGWRVQQARQNRKAGI